MTTTKSKNSTKKRRVTRVPVKPDLFRWARERAGLEQEELKAKFTKLPEWERGEMQPTLKQVEAFAHALHVPVGYLFLSNPPEEPIPIPDFRTIGGEAVERLSPNLLDTIYTCQERQNWYRNFMRIDGQAPLSFVGSATIKSSPAEVAARMRKTLDFDLAARRECLGWTASLRLFVRRAEKAGILVMISGVVMNNNHRRLSPAEFRGFALSDPLAPLIFVNGADTKGAQMFTLAHELAHLWLGISALSNIEASNPRTILEPGIRREETWCNAVAAEFLVPLPALKAELKDHELLPEVLSRLARTFKVSNLVILRRLLDAGWLSRDRFDSAWMQEMKHLQTHARSSSGGGNFYHTTLARASRRFARALVASTLGGQTLYRDAFRMLGISKTQTFNNLAREAGAMR